MKRRQCTSLFLRTVKRSHKIVSVMRKREPLSQIQLGRIFRQMGLPFWTFLGVGFAGWWFDNAGTLIKTFLRQLFNLDGEVLKWQTYLPSLIMFLIPCAVVLGIALWQSMRHQNIRGKFTTSQLQQPEGKKGLILLVSNPNSAIYAINYHFLSKGTLERLWLIPSNDSQADKFGDSTQTKVCAIKQYCEALQQGRLDVEIHSTGVSPADAQDTFDYVNRVFRRSGYKPNELIADFTGGTKPMAVGMIMACLPKMRELQYVSFNPKTKQSYGPFLIDYQYSAFDLVE